MIESYTRALWLEFVVDDERAKQLMTRDKSAYNILSGECPSGDFMSRMNRLSGGPS